jgi:hypothetical protein
MNPATHATEGGATAPVLYMALELSNKSWRLAFGDGAKHRQMCRCRRRIWRRSPARWQRQRSASGCRPRPAC